LANKKVDTDNLAAAAAYLNLVDAEKTSGKKTSIHLMLLNQIEIKYKLINSAIGL
jgi:hypothetical protein